ncbi:restriction endonuclease subunit S [Endozoicomonas sp. SM1973]|uniref:Restriction endonuclease subunit S n=1 Tax=Spartinivicinus marinus TaxID=2994442 RepID=A0A853I8Z1_9GAMM|nr:restriction endonuclease subunit S [Spartinivicinus marinus]MCX4028616.1 restriction endonuclease subunit S [Spartinivicinus marinus]NYZ67118.1 restriction endonuclease subunit S [Spartinivicinus marinus]
MNALVTMPKYEAYKDSGVEWIGKLPEHWELKKIKYLFDFTERGTAPSYSEEGITVINQSCLSSYSLNFKKAKFHDSRVDSSSFRGNLFKGDLLIASTGLGVLGKCAVYSSDSKAFADSHVTILRDEKGRFSTCFTYYVFSTLYDFINSKMSEGATKQTELQRDDLRAFLMPVPPRIELKKIIDFLKSKTAQIDQAIVIKEKQIALLKERRQIIIQKAVTQGLDPNVPMKDSGVDWIGKIPEHWEVRTNRFLFKERNESGKEGLPLLSVSIHTGVSSEELSEENNIRGRVKIEDKSKYNFVRRGDIVFNMMRAWQGAIGAVTVEGMVSPAYIIAEPTNQIDSTYFEYMYRSPGFIHQMDKFSKGITDFRKRLYWDEFKQLYTICPPIKEQIAITCFIRDKSNKIDVLIELQNKQIQKLKEYKTTLINSAVTGKIKVA